MFAEFENERKGVKTTPVYEILFILIFKAFQF